MTQWLAKIETPRVVRQLFNTPDLPRIDGTYGPFKTQTDAKAFVVALQQVELNLETLRNLHGYIRTKSDDSPQISVSYEQVKSPLETFAQMDRAKVNIERRNAEHREYEESQRNFKASTVSTIARLRDDDPDDENPVLHLDASSALAKLLDLDTDD